MKNCDKTGHLTKSLCIVYEVNIIFEDIGAFKAYMDTREELGILARYADIKSHIKGGTLYEGARCFEDI